MPCSVDIGPMILLFSFYLYTIISPWKRAWPFVWTDIGSLYPRRLCHQFVSLVEIGPVVLEKKMFIFRQCILAISISPPLGKGRGPSFEQTLHPQHPRMLCAKLVEIGWMVREKKVNMWKVYRQADDMRSEKLTWALSSAQLRWNKRPTCTGLNGHLCSRNYTDFSPYS